jgi:tetratricopeptide (TPR) repeat protein
MYDPLKYFVGRKNEVDTFKHCFSSPSHNGVYYFGAGGIGKTMLLKKVIDTCEAEQLGQPFFIDFFTTRNRSIEGVREVLMQCLNRPHAFQEIVAIREQINKVKQEPEFIGKREWIVSLQKQLDASFAACCNAAASDRTVVLVFDSFEYVQQRDTGRWFLEDFLPYLERQAGHGIVVVVAGRPEPQAARTPSSIFRAELGTLSRDEVRTYFQEKVGIPWSDDLENLYEVSGGNPLIIELLRWRSSTRLIQELKSLQEPLASPKVLAEKIFDKLMEDERYKVIRRVLWAMATFKRRFDEEMLKFLVENVRWLRTANYDDIRGQLQEFPFVKNDEEHSSHLLHDMVVEPIAILFQGVDEVGALRDDLFQQIVHNYYDQCIKTEPLPNLRMYFQAEQLGYLIEENLAQGLAKYKEYLHKIEETHNYHFDDLLWEEVYEHLAERPQENIEFILEKAEWYYKNGLYSQLEILARAIFKKQELTPEDRLRGSQYLGFALMRQGKLWEADQQFQASLKLAQRIPDDMAVAETENNFAQVALLAGRYDTAATRYWNAIQGYSKVKRFAHLAVAHSAYGSTLARQGNYQRALTHCKQALKLLEKYPDTFRQI